MRVTLIHLSVLAPNEQESKMAILMANLIDTQMVNPPKILEILLLGGRIGSGD